MKEIKGRQLFVNLGASQVRKRLKHFGHGVRKVGAIGRGQAVVIHTASGEHRRELEALFDDVGCAESEAELGVPIESHVFRSPVARIKGSTNVSTGKYACIRAVLNSGETLLTALVPEIESRGE